MENISVWNKYIKYSFDELKNNIETDILIIGGGTAGILSAFYIKESNLKITLVERNKLLTSTTSKMTAKVTILQDILTKISNNNLDLYIKSQLDGLKLLKDNIDKNKIDCDFIKNDSYLWTNKKINIKKIKKIEKVLNNININYSNDSLPIKELNSLYSIKTDSYEINPIKYLNHIINFLNINIYENTNIIKVFKKDDKYIAKTDNNINIIAKKIIFATNYPYFIKPLFFPLKVTLEKSNILYGKSKYVGKYNLINIDKNIYSIRFYKNKMIYLSNNKYISHISSKDINKDDKLIDNVDYYWSNMDIITNDYLPIIGEIKDNIYIITGFNTWGILSSHVGAKYLSLLILNQKENLKYNKIFDPKRGTTVQKIINSSLNIYESMNGYLKGFMNIKNPTCPHMKCHLIYNKIEKTWDCPCHGSRFAKDGKIISGPSKYNIK